MTDETLRTMLRKIPDDGLSDEAGFWTRDAEDKFVELAKELIGRGMTPAEAVEFLRRAYNVVASEFGS